MLSVRFNGSEALIRNYSRYSKDIEKKVGKIINDVLEATAKDGKSSIVRNNHVITGKLRDSMKHELKHSNGIFNGRAGSFDCFYAIYVERLDPFLFPAWEAQKQVLRRELSKIF